MGVADVNQAGTGVSMGAVWGDYDNDGLRGSVPLQVRPSGAVSQRAGATASRAVGERAGLPGWVNANSAVWLDYDRDGWLDLFVAGLLAGGRRPLASDDHADHAGELRVRGERRPQVPVPQSRRRHVRRDVGARSGSTRAAGRSPSAPPICSAPAIPDLFLANDYGVSQLYANRGGKRFVDVGRETGVGRTPKSGMNAAFGDVFNDGRLSIYKTNISEPGVLVQANDLWVPKSRQRAGGGRRVRESRVEPGRGSRRLELGRAVRRSEQRRHARSLSGERLRLGGRAHELLVRLRADRRRAQRDHRRRAQLAADEGPKPVGVSAQARLDQRRRSADSPRWRRWSARPTSTTAARSRWPICRTAACST